MAQGEAGTATSNGMHGTEATEAAEGQSPWGWLKMPKVTMPKVTMPKISMPKMPADPLAPIKSSAAKVTDGTKKAWEGTKEMFTGGSKTANTHAASKTGEQPSIWKRMFGGEEEPQPPQTVADFMAQKRVE
jgi:hypothetical protein